MNSYITKIIFIISTQIILLLIIYSKYGFKLVWAYLLLIFIVAAIMIVFFTVTLKSKQGLFDNSQINNEKTYYEADKRLSNSIKFKTISYADKNKIDLNEFNGFLNYIKESYPQINSNLTKEIINNYSVVFEWKGRSSEADPLLLLAHYDVVPVDKEINEWSYSPCPFMQQCI